MQDEWRTNAHSQKCVVDASEQLLAALDHFNGTLATLTEKTIEDTIATVRSLEHARFAPCPPGILTFPMASLHCRLEYDAYRSELARVQARAATTSGMNLAAEMHDAEQQVHTHQDTYEQLKKDVDVR